MNLQQSLLVGPALGKDPRVPPPPPSGTSVAKFHLRPERAAFTDKNG